MCTRNAGPRAPAGSSPGVGRTSRRDATSSTRGAPASVGPGEGPVDSGVPAGNADLRASRKQASTAGSMDDSRSGLRLGRWDLHLEIGERDLGGGGGADHDGEPAAFAVRG